MSQKARPESVLFITLDSCRYDTFIGAEIPNLRAVGPVYRCMAPGNFTYSSHAAMFMGFTPGVAEASESFVNPMFGKIFKMRGGGFSGPGKHRFILDGENIVDGFKIRGYHCIGTGALFWFDSSRETGRVLTRDFHDFYFPGNVWFLEKQLNWINEKLKNNDDPVFLFLNIGETHFPYYFKGAPWSREINPCQPMAGETNDAVECRNRQKACLEYVDANLKSLLEYFTESNTIICADHGDCWGEDNLWGHGMHHEKVLEVPLVMRLTPDYDSDMPFFQKLIRRVRHSIADF
ncbi:MAG: sulfatase-like hydrolase/transferase [Smithella sp.]